MTHTDKILICRDCGKEFVFNAEEREFYSRLGFDTEPTRCRKCRRLHKRRSGRMIYEAICAKCGGTAVLRFEPRHDLPVYCRECHIQLNASDAAHTELNIQPE